MKFVRRMRNQLVHHSMTKVLQSVAFVMPVLNEELYLRSAVESILQQQTPGSAEVILALGPSTDNTNKIAADLASDFKVILVENPTGGTSAGLNLAIAKATADVIVRVDAHSVLNSNYTALAVEILNQTKASNVGGVMRAVGEKPFQKSVAWAYTSRFGLGGGTFHVGGQAGPSDSVYLGVFDRNALLEVGGFDEKVVRGQDWELNLRLRQSGKVVWFDPRLEVQYFPRSSWSKLARQFFDTGIWRGELTRRSPRTASLRYFAPPVLVLAWVAGLVLAAAGFTWALIPLAAYVGAIALVAVTASKLPLSARAFLVVTLPTMHLWWGAGFWVGLLTNHKR